ncbi:hypothetical protein QC281_45370, partial [Streptomyces sp. DH17]|nr:hypothetical protein [Streptomyces sp. DH17]
EYVAFSDALCLARSLNGSKPTPLKPSRETSHPNLLTPPDGGSPVARSHAPFSGATDGRAARAN